MSRPSSFRIRPLDLSDKPWIEELLESSWGGIEIVSRGNVHQADQLPGFVAVQNEKRIGLLTYHTVAGECEIVSIESLCEGQGIGSALIDAVRQVAIQRGCRRLWLIATNDNLLALRFYQKRGFRLAAIYPNALEHSRKLKPQIPLTGLDGIALRDEIELEMLL